MFRNRREYDDDSYRSDFFLGEMEEKSHSTPPPHEKKAPQTEKDGA